MLLLPITRPASVSRLHLSPPRPLPSAQRWHPMVGPGEDKYNPSASYRHVTFLTFPPLSLCSSKVSREETNYRSTKKAFVAKGVPEFSKSPPDYLTHTHTRPSAVPNSPAKRYFPKQGSRAPVPGCRTDCIPLRLVHAHHASSPTPRATRPRDGSQVPGCRGALAHYTRHPGSTESQAPRPRTSRTSPVPTLAAWQRLPVGVVPRVSPRALGLRGSCRARAGGGGTETAAPEASVRLEPPPRPPA